MNDRPEKEAIAVLTWLCGHLLLGIIAVIMIGGRHASRDATLEFGTNKREDRHRQQEAKQVRVKLPKVQQVSAKKKQGGLAPNKVEPKPVPVAELTAQQMQEITEQYCQTYSEKNVQVILNIQRGTSLDPFGQVFLFEMPDGSKRMFDTRGSASGTRGHYAIPINRSDIPDVVIGHAASAVGEFAVNNARIRLVLKQDVEVQMHRSLYDFLRRNSDGQLKRNHIYHADVAVSSPVNFRWRESEPNEG